MKDDYWQQIEEAAKGADSPFTIRREGGLVHIEALTHCAEGHPIGIAITTPDPQPIVDELVRQNNRLRTYVYTSLFLGGSGRAGWFLYFTYLFAGR
jgi:hypothetical protein